MKINGKIIQKINGKMEKNQWEKLPLSSSSSPCTSLNHRVVQVDNCRGECINMPQNRLPLRLAHPPHPLCEVVGDITDQQGKIVGCEQGRRGRGLEKGLLHYINN